MSEKKEKTTAEVKKDKKATAPKKENFFKRVGKAISKFFKDFKGECKKITWPSGKTVVNNSIVVIVVVAVVGLVIFGIDTGLSAIIDALVGLARDKAAADAAAVTETTTGIAVAMIQAFFMK